MKISRGKLKELFCYLLCYYGKTVTRGDFINFIRKNIVIDVANIKEAERILQFYNGDYLEEEDYIWAEDVRSWIEKNVEKLMISTALYYSSLKEYKKAEKYFQRLLLYNPLSEEGYESLLELYLKCKADKKFIKQYIQYKNIMKNQLREPLVKRYKKIFL